VHHEKTVEKSISLPKKTKPEKSISPPKKGKPAKGKRGKSGKKK